MSLLVWLLIIFAIVWYLLFRNRTKQQKIPVKLVITTERRTTQTDQYKYEPNSDHDNWEGAFWEVQSPRNVSANLRIVYQDGAGSRTTRNIRLMKYGPWDGGAILWAYCHLRQANRTFRTDRIISCTDIDSGEIIDNLETWLDTKYQSSPDCAIEKIVETAWDALRVLYYVSKADGRLTKKEREIVRNAIRTLCDHPKIDDKRIDDMFDSIDNPTITAFKQAFGRLIKQNRELAEKVVAWSESLVATENTVSPTEQEALNYIKIKLENSAAQQKTSSVT